MSTSQAGKGDKPRPILVPRKEYDERFDAIDWTKKETTAKHVVSKKGKTTYKY